MSSSTYSADLTPEPALRRLVLLAAAIAATLGTVTIIGLPVGAALRAAGCGIWLAVCAVQATLIALAQRRYRRMRLFAGGDVRLQDVDGQWQPAALARGSLVLPTLAWLRLRPEAGGYCYELLRGSVRESQQWRRLQVIWRHLGTTA